MTISSERASLHVPSRTIPVPTTVSPEAQAILALPPPPPPGTWPEDLSDKQAVAEVMAGWDDSALRAWPEPISAMLFGTAMQDLGNTTVEHVMLGDVSVYIATPEGVTDDDPRSILAIHGAWIFGAGEFSRLGAMYTAVANGVRTWAVDYRMPPLHPYPVPLNDCMVAYNAMLENYGAENLAVIGASAGGNMGLALLLRSADEGLPMPAAAVFHSPMADCTNAGDTHQTLEMWSTPDFLDGVVRIYLDGHDPLDPYVSPIYGNYSDEFPPAMLTTGTRDVLLSDTCRVHRRLLQAGVEAELHCWEAAPHSFFAAYAPEEFERAATTRRFLDAHWGEK